MNSIVKSIETIIQDIKVEIGDYYNKCYSYFLDLIISKQVKVNSTITLDDENTIRKNILTMISATNSALNTIGVSSSLLSLNSELYNETFENHRSNFISYFNYFNLSLRTYINKYLFIGMIEYISNFDDKKIQNLDLFDLLPRGFLDKLNQMKYQTIIPADASKQINQFFIQIDDYFDATNLVFKQKDFELGIPKEIRSEAEFLIKLQEARVENIEALSHQDMSLKNNVVHTSFLESIMGTPISNNSYLNQLQVNLIDLSNFLISKASLLDLENLFYASSIYKFLERKFPLNRMQITTIMSKYLSGKIFSTGKYHIPNPVSIFYGLSLFRHFDLMDSSEIVDRLDIEMFLEKELENFIPDKLYLNFYTILSLKILEKDGGVIKDKTHLVEHLKNLNLYSLEKSKLSMDLFYYLSTLNIVDYNIDSNDYLEDIGKLKLSLLENGSINNSITDTARSLLALNFINHNDGNLVNRMLKFIIQNANCFNSNISSGEFNWRTNKTAFKLELRMLYWTLFVFSQYH